ncbi:MAG: thermonuclease family protein [Solirubrobacteraceae bacterium]|nr:thermonuclease family protein [Solirubrobacteraceae bacterium]
MRRRRRPATWLAVALLAAAIFGAGAYERASGPSAGDQSASSAIDTVVRVVDGDTVVLRSAGRSRLIGVDTPEVFGRRECFGAEASQFAKRTLRPGLRVGVERDAEPHDRYGRSLVYLTLPDGRSFNELLVGKGLAVPLTIAPNVRYAERFRELADRARDVREGLWSPDTCDGDGDRAR